ncbi:MAG: hypothetical protein U5R14_03930 [Gemmatimonadota bacterium]|nr:hypothetical protein [Gemmatimonadota bacterium]
MNHMDESTILALRDGEAVPDVSRDHLEECSACESALREAEWRAEHIDRLLGTLDEPGVGGTRHSEQLNEARARVRERLDARIEDDLRSRRRFRWPGHLGRAAAVLLVAVGAVSALPGLPLHSWLTSAGSDDRATPGATAETAQEVPRSGVSVAVPQEGIRVLVGSLGSLGSLEVVWIDEATARIDAPEGSRFTYGDGRLEALVAGGPVRIELPDSEVPVTVEVDGEPYLTRSEGQTDVTGPIGERTDARILFTTP